MKLQQTTAIIIIFIIIQIQVLYGNQEKSSCGRRLVHHETLITHGFESNEGSWPWHAAIFHIEINWNIVYKCGGSVITSNAILTAAHCVYQNGQPIIPDRVVIELGKHNLKISSANTQHFEAFKIIAHPNYRTLDENNDIAVMILSTEATFNNYVQPICLWDSNKMDIYEVIGRNGYVIGWGFTETDQISFILRQAVMPVVSLTTCLLSNRDFFGSFLSDNNFCAGFRNGTSVCNGDSGGSITFEDDGVYRIRGIVSLTLARGNESLCNTEEYVIFTDVAKYLHWIEKVIPGVKGSELNLGSRCLTQTSEPGICTGLYDCPTILDDLKKGIRNHVECGHKGSEPVVCCKQLDIVTERQISAKKCKEYSKFATSSCVSTPVSEVIGVMETKVHEFPHMALIGFGEDNEIVWRCGGSLISDRFVLSAAQCSETIDTGTAKYVRLGEHNLNQPRDAASIDFNIIERILYQNYQYMSYYHDIVLFKLNKAVQFTEAIRPACLPEQSTFPTKAIVTGWGLANRNRIRSKVLTKVELEIVSHTECNTNPILRSRRLPNEIIDAIQVCAGSHLELEDTCTESGSPLQLIHEIQHCSYTIVGITSFGVRACGTISIPDVYTRVHPYLSWIEGIVWPNE